LKVLNLSNSKYLTKSPDFSQVPQLEILILEGCTSLVQVHKSIGHLKRLDLLNLKNCTKLKYLPRSIFKLESLKTLDLSGCSAFEKLPEQLQSSLGLSMINLKIASFFGCSSLIELPNFSHTPQLERLELKGRTSLVEVHESIGHLKRLAFLDLESCEKLRNLPNSISNLESLESLYLTNCINLENLPEQLGNMTALIELDVSFTAIKQIPSSFRLLRNLEYVCFSGCQCLIESPEFSQSLCIEELEFDNCTSLVKIHESIGHLEKLIRLDFSGCKKLKILDLSRNNFRNLPSCISRLPKLEALNLNKCTTLQSISIPSVICLKAKGCTSLERVSVLTNEGSSALDYLHDCSQMKAGRVAYIELGNCHKLVEINLESLLRIPGSLIMGSCNNLSSDLRESAFLYLLKVLSLSLSLSLSFYDTNTFLK